MKSDWFVYVVRCADNSLYTGIATDVDRRIQQHNGDLVGGAKYTRPRQPVKLVYQQQVDSRSDATIQEMAIKKMPKKAKEKMVRLARSNSENRQREDSQ